MFWCLYKQLQRCWYWGPSWTSTMKLFCNSMHKSWNFQLGSKYTCETLNRFYFDYLTLIWLGYLRSFYQFHELIYLNCSKNYYEKKNQIILCLRLTGHILAFYISQKWYFLWKKIKIKLSIILTKVGQCSIVEHNIGLEYSLSK